MVKVNHVLILLDEDGISTIADLLGPSIQYSLVKQRLISTYSIPQATRFGTIVQHGGMGDRRPWQMLCDVRNMLPGVIGDAALKEFWQQKLPQHILTVISGLDGSLEFLAERADRVMDARIGRNISVVIATRDADTRFSAIENALLALTTQIAALTTSQSNTAANRQPRSGTAPIHVHIHIPRHVPGIMPGVSITIGTGRMP